MNGTIEAGDVVYFVALVLASIFVGGVVGYEISVSLGK